MTSAFFATFTASAICLAVLFRIARRHRILIPRPADGDLAAFAVEHLGVLADLRADALEHRNFVLRHAAVAAQQAAVGVGSNHGDGLDGVRVERGDLVLVLEQRDGLARGLQRQFAMLVAAHHALGLIGIDIGIVEQPHLELPEEHGRDQLVELLLLEHALPHQLHQVQVAVRLRQLDVDARLNREPARLLFVFGDEVAVRVRTVAEFPDGVVVRDDEALEAPLLAQHVAQQPLVGVRGNAVDFVVRGHHVMAPASRRASLKVYRKVSRNTRRETFAGAQFMPDSGWPWPTKCFSVAMTCRLSRKFRSPWNPFTAAIPSRETRYGSSP